jgi:Arc/MetJ family transcription regulator
MTRHTIDIDRALLLECQEALGTLTLSETVREVLRWRVTSARRGEALASEETLEQQVEDMSASEDKG